MSEHDTTPENTDTPSDIMTSTEAMAFLRMGRTAFYTALRAGEIPCRRYSQRLIRFSRTALTADVLNGTGAAAAAHAPPPLKNFELQQAPAIPNSGNDNGRVPGTTMNGEQRAEAKRIYLANVNSGQPLKEAAIEAGVTMGAVRNWRDSDKAFEAAESAVRT